jgi:hypothetical protein
MLFLLVGAAQTVGYKSRAGGILMVILVKQLFFGQRS